MKKFSFSAIAVFGLIGALFGCGDPGIDWRPDNVTGMSVSPDGRYIAFVGKGRGGSDLYLLDQKNNTVKQLTDSPECERSVRFSSSGKLLVYTDGGEDTYATKSIYIRSIDGHLVRRITNGGDQRHDYAPTFSADDSEIAFLGCFSPRYVTGDLFVVKTDGTNLRRLTHENFNSYIRPCFYRNDKQILFESYKNPVDAIRDPYPPTFISSFDTMTGQWRERIHYGTSISAIPVSAPNDDRILYIADHTQETHYDIFLQADINAKPQSLHVSNLGSGPVCLCFVSKDNCVYFMLNDLEIWKVGIDGKNPMRVADKSLFDDPMHWKHK